MSEDRLELLKKKIKLPVTWGKFIEADRDWLISEVERFQQKDGLRTREHNILVQENRKLTATISTMREAMIRLKAYIMSSPSLSSAYSLAHSHGWRMDDNELRVRNEAWREFDEALAAAQEDTK